MNFKFLCLLLCGLLLLSGCSSSAKKPNYDPLVDEAGRSLSIESMNTALKSQAGVSAQVRAYRLGTGDKVDILIYQAPELSRIYQVNSKGEIQMPLLGAVNLDQLTIVEAQETLTAQLAERFMRDPQVTMSVTEFSANEISVLGEVSSPRIYSVKQGRNPLEMLIMAGGLRKSAGKEMIINTSTRQEESGERRDVRMIVDINSILNPITEEDYKNLKLVRNLTLKAGDSVYVPPAGVVYIDGAIKRPGSYDMADDTTILSLLALAGGAEWTSSSRKVRVLRKIDQNTNTEFQLDLARIRNNQEDNFKLKSGDLVLVGHNNFKYGLKAFWEYGLRFMFLL